MTPDLSVFASARLPPWTSGVKRQVLPNGLTLLVQRDGATPAAAVVTHVKAGFFDEPDHWNGISHVLEHMFFKGTPSLAVGEIARATKALGGYLNAHTSYDHTAYFVVLPATRLEQALTIQADALRHAQIDAGELARELQVIIQEAKRKLDSPSAVTAETLHQVMFDRHRIRRWRIGTEEVLARFTRDDVLAYYRSRYVPGRVILSIVGAVDEEEVIRLAQRLYGDWPPAPAAEDRSPEEPWRHELRARTLRGDVQQAELAVGWRGVPPLHSDAAPLSLAASVLSAGRASWLYRTLREPGIVTAIGAHHYAPTEVGVFSVGADLDPEAMDRALAGIAAEVLRLGDEGPESVDLERAKTLATARWARRLESVHGRAAAYAVAEALDGVDLLDREYGELMAVTPEQIRRAVSTYLHPEQVSAVAYLPNGRGADLTSEAVRHAFAAPSGGPRPTAPGLATVPVPLGRPGRGVHVAGTLHLVLPGTDLLVRRKPGVPLVTLSLYRRRSGFDQPDSAGLGALAVRSAVRGAGDLDAAALAQALERLGGTLGTSVSADWFGMATTVLADHLGEAAALLRTVLLQPRFEEAEVLKERATLLEEVTQTTDDMFRYPMQLALAQAFGGVGYGLPPAGWPETVPGLTVDQVRRWHTCELGQGRTAVVAVGDLEIGRAADLLAGLFQDLPTLPAQRAPTISPPGARGDGDGARVVRRAKSQTALAMIFPGPSRRDPSRHAAQVWAAIASGLGGRLFDELRERRSLAYTVTASTWQRAGAGALVTYIATSPEREHEARDAMLLELARFQEQPATRRELEQAVNYLAGQAEVQRETGASVAGEILDAWLVGTGLEELADPAAGYRRVTVEAVQEVARRWLVAEVRSEGVVQGTGA